MRHTSLAVLLAAVGGAGFLLPLRGPRQGVWYSVGTYSFADEKYAFKEVPQSEANGVLVLHYWYPGMPVGPVDEWDTSRFPVRWNPHADERGFGDWKSHQSFGHGDAGHAGEFVRLGGRGWGTIDVELSGYWRWGGKDGKYETVVTFPWHGEPVVRDLGGGATVRISFDDPKPAPPIDNAK